MSFFLRPLPLTREGGRLQHYLKALGLSLVAEETLLSHLPWGGPVAWPLCKLAPLPLAACSEHGDRRNVSTHAQARKPLSLPTDLAVAENVWGLAGRSFNPRRPPVATTPPNHALQGERHKEGWHCPGLPLILGGECPRPRQSQQMEERWGRSLLHPSGPGISPH